MKRHYLLITLIGLAVLAACNSAEPTAEIRETAAGETITTMDENEVMEEEMESMPEQAEAASEEMTHDETGMEDEAMDEAAMANEAESSMEEPSMEEEAAMEMEEAVDAMALPAWGQIVLTNARTGESFSLADFAGQTVFVEPMATWCTNCRMQLHNVREARAQLGDENTQFVALSLETNISDDTLAQYADGQGFDWLFAVMTPEMLQEMANEFGRAVTSAPSTPHFIIRPDGSFTDLTTGIESPQQILDQIQAASG